ncbi:high-affinity branched-chain amino acid transport system permease protein LivH [Oxobacter pfennigii]|uniref:High-affinity branched-chain amino acid transport system permease protein LivH n=1 Tax=Oxobacter pfennigii TaxID=36849 RepID=A0A0P8W8M0_9CLOT|nr:branched-chain amino acid ABC transporter permease [Oxobacter pfennigii]KPU44068.1 high-affinity branched-chain amino acid transport system permease protein LivH [Oxobacter pfennigii]
MKERTKYLIVIGIAVLVYLVLANLMRYQVLNNYHIQIITFAGINIILAVSLNLINGITGQLSLGHAGFMSVGGYVASVASIKMGIPFLPALILGGIAAAIVGCLIGFPTLRLKGDYLAITTLGFGEIIRVLFVNIEYVGGARGLMGIPKKTTFDIVYLLAVVTVLVVINIINSTHGRALKSIREDEIAAEAMGINTTKYKVMAFTVAAAFAGIAGGLYAHYIMYINPKSFDFLKSIDIVIMVVMGGMGSIIGSIFSSIVLTILPEALRQFSDYRMVIYSLALILVMIYRPSGLLGTKELSISGAAKRLKKLFGKERGVKDGTSKS